MEKNLKLIKEGIAIVTSDKSMNELIKELIEKPYDCFGRAYKEDNGECCQCTIMSEFREKTGEYRRDPLWVICREACNTLLDVPDEIIPKLNEEGGEIEMEQVEQQVRVEFPGEYRSKPSPKEKVRKPRA